MFDRTLAYWRCRTPFGQPIGSLQQNRFVLAEMATELEPAETYLEKAVREQPVAKALVDGRVQTVYGGTTEVMKEIIGRALGV